MEVLHGLLDCIKTYLVVLTGLCTFFAIGGFFCFSDMVDADVYIKRFDLGPKVPRVQMIVCLCNHSMGVSLRSTIRATPKSERVTCMVKLLLLTTGVCNSVLALCQATLLVLTGRLYRALRAEEEGADADDGRPPRKLTRSEVSIIWERVGATTAHSMGDGSQSKASAARDRSR